VTGNGGADGKLPSNSPSLASTLCRSCTLLHDLGL
jgi:hypothetical protein